MHWIDLTVLILQAVVTVLQAVTHKKVSDATKNNF